MYNFKTDEQGYLPLIQIRIMQVIMEAFGRMVPLNADLFENIKGLNEDRLFSVIENELGIEIDEDRRRSVRTPDDIISLMGEVMTEDEIRIYYMKVTLINLRRMRAEYVEDGFDEDEENDEEFEDDEEFERKFRESLNNIAQTLNVEQIVCLWNEGIELNTLDADDLYIYKEVLAIHGVSVSEMEDAEAIDNRLKIQYDVENNRIRCIE